MLICKNICALNSCSTLVMSNIATFAMKFIHFYLYISLEKIKMHAKYKAE